jgi:hypothetical protein
MRTFHYLPPGTEEQRAFALQFMLTVAGVGVAGFLAWRATEAGLRVLCLAGIVALIYTLAKSAWEMEKRARRAQVAQIQVADDALILTDERSILTRIGWDEVSEIGVSGGRLTVTWNGGSFAVGARELENGMGLIRAVHAARERAQGRFAPPTNFIPLDSM